MRILEKLTIRNFKSIREQTIEPGLLNIFIGANGAGKSNLIEVFRFLREIANRNLAGYTAQKGGADKLLYFGRKTSPQMELSLAFGAGHTSNAYDILLRATDDDSLVIRTETVLYHDKKMYPNPYNQIISSSSKESSLRQTKHICARQVAEDLENYRVYHFHDTSESAAVKGMSDVHDNRFLRSQAGNLAAFLFWLQEKEPDHFNNIVDTVRQVAPFFDCFVLEPSKLNESKIMLEWREKGSDAYFNASSFSDGTLRFICLATLLLQPRFPAVILLDEPELGLHPAAITLLAELLIAASTRTQVIVSTQSVTLVNQFDPEHVWTVDREDRQSVFRRLRDADMTAWLEEYSLGELWEKNLIGARP